MSTKWPFLRPEESQEIRRIPTTIGIQSGIPEALSISTDQQHKPLSAALIGTAKGAETHCDGGGLNLRIEAAGTKRWFQRVTIDGKRRNIGLGAYRAVSLAEARKAALDNSRIIREGRDPLAERRQAIEARQQPTIPTFAASANIVIDMRRSTWSNAKHAAQWTSSLSTYACPAIGNKMIPDVTTAEVLTVLSPVGITKSELANRVRHHIATVLGWAIAQGYRTDNQAARSITTVLPQMPRTKRHHRALHYRDVPAALVMVKGPTAVARTKLAKEWCIERRQTIWAVGKRLSPTSWVLRQSRHTRGLIFLHSG